MNICLGKLGLDPLRRGLQNETFWPFGRIPLLQEWYGYHFDILTATILCLWSIRVAVSEYSRTD